jgi:hypothetical protein
MNTPAARGACQGSEMRIDAIDICWARLPLAFNFRTSYGDRTAAHAAVRG